MQNYKPKQVIIGGGSSTDCVKCGKSIGATEKIHAIGNNYHKLCFTCEKCHRILQKGEENSLNNQAYCKTCHAKESKLTTVGSSSTNSNSTTLTHTSSFNNNFKSGTGCKKCGKSVGIADKIKAAASEFHKDCFACHECNKVLTLVTYKEDKEHNVYCDACYKKTHANAFGSVKKGPEKSGLEVEKFDAASLGGGGNANEMINEQDDLKNNNKEEDDDGGLSEITGEVDEVAKMLAALNKNDE